MIYYVLVELKIDAASEKAALQVADDCIEVGKGSDVLGWITCEAEEGK